MAVPIALLAIAMWASLASLTVALGGLPPLYLTGVSLFIGGALSLPWIRYWSFSWRALAVGTYGQFTYHVLYILALRNAPAASANLVHYAWPLLTVLLAPLAGRGGRLKTVDVLAGLVAFGGLSFAMLDGVDLSMRWYSGYGFALAAAFVWATYSIAEASSTSSSPVDVGPACMVSGLLALLGHFWLEPSVQPSNQQWMLLLALGIGPTGGAFYLWSLALRRGEPRVIGVVSYITPLISTAVLLATQGRPPTLPLVAAASLVTMASLAVYLANRPRVSVS